MARFFDLFSGPNIAALALFLGSPLSPNQDGNAQHARERLGAAHRPQGRPPPSTASTEHRLEVCPSSGSRRLPSSGLLLCFHRTNPGNAKTSNDSWAKSLGKCCPRRGTAHPLCRSLCSRRQVRGSPSRPTRFTYLSSLGLLVQGLCQNLMCFVICS